MVLSCSNIELLSRNSLEHSLPPSDHGQGLGDALLSQYHTSFLMLVSKNLLDSIHEQGGETEDLADRV